ncbi:MAG: hypothetical protein PUF50_07370 [Erysipelotrichaceae bacterium]|nr:hypothetical protein [Erysipelotrichaceae bacterium]
MTVYELYKKAINVMFEKPNSKVYENYYLTHINLLLANVFDINNTIRNKNGLESLDVIPVMTNDNDEIPYEDIVLNEILPWGLAAQFSIDDDLNKYSIYNTNFLNACFKHERAIISEVSDVYG